MQAALLCLACLFLALVATVTIFTIGIHYFGWLPILCLLLAVAAILGVRYVP